MFWSRCIICTKRVLTISLSSLVNKRRILEFTKILTSLQLFLINLILLKRFISRSVSFITHNPKMHNLIDLILLKRCISHWVHLFLQANFFNNCIAQVVCTKLKRKLVLIDRFFFCGFRILLYFPLSVCVSVYRRDISIFRNYFMI